MQATRHAPPGSVGIGGALGAWLAGYIFDRTGSYQWTWVEVGVAFAMAILLGWLVAPP
jgi:cyanate permease